MYRWTFSITNTRAQFVKSMCKYHHSVCVNLDPKAWVGLQQGSKVLSKNVYESFKKCIQTCTVIAYKSRTFEYSVERCGPWTFYYFSCLLIIRALNMNGYFTVYSSIFVVIILYNIMLILIVLSILISTRLLKQCYFIPNFSSCLVWYPWIPRILHL